MQGGETILPARTFPFWFVFDRLARFWISLRGLATVSDPFSFSARTIRTKIFLFRPMGVSVVTIHYGRLNAVQVLSTANAQNDRNSNVYFAFLYVFVCQSSHFSREIDSKETFRSASCDNAPERGILADCKLQKQILMGMPPGGV